MKKRYIVAATAALLGGGMLVEMQVGSKGLDRIEIAASGGGGVAAGGRRAGGADGALAARVPARPKALPAAIEPVEEPAMLTVATDDNMGLLAKSSIWSEPTFDAMLLPRGFADTPAPQPGANALAGPGRGIGGSYPLAGDINRASGMDALAAVRDRPLSASAVPDPATWLSLIVGLAMIGFNLRRRQGRRSVAS